MVYPTYDCMGDNSFEKMSKIISFLRFPLAVMIVMTHADFDRVSMGGADYIFQLSDYPIFLNVSYLISGLLVRVAVPLFFFSPVSYFLVI